jgi:hypothetical protein
MAAAAADYNHQKHFKKTPSLFLTSSRADRLSNLSKLKAAPRILLLLLLI